ncbi:hypothetical protein JYT51_00735 [Candidatus Amoebophilus asiaticus]|nr:hypothetical protein [Candidatus Amoebophilus asiaticus]
MRNNWRLYILFIFIVIQFGCKFFAEVKVSGKIYTIQNQDTIPIHNVTVNIYITEMRDGLWDNNYTASTDSMGNYNIVHKPVPYQCIYQLTFEKEGFIPQQISKELGSSESFVYDVSLKKQFEGSNKKLEFKRYKRKADPKESTYLFLIALAALLLVILLFKYHYLYQYLIDLFRKVFKRKFKDLSKKKQEKILSKSWCSKCKAYTKISYTSEEEKEGMMFVFGNCDQCDDEVRFRYK